MKAIIFVVLGFAVPTFTFVAQAHADNWNCLCYAEPGHLGIGIVKAQADSMVSAQSAAGPGCKARAWGNFGKTQYSLNCVKVSDDSEDTARVAKLVNFASKGTFVKVDDLCSGPGSQCQNTDDCCGSSQCANGICNAGISCTPSGGSCTYSVECCSGDCDGAISCN